MGELWQRGRVNLTWSPGHELHGLEVVMRRQPFGQVLDEWETSDSDASGWLEASLKERAARSRDGAAHIVGLIISWNLADEKGAPVPITTDGLLSVCDFEMIEDMKAAYLEATRRVSPPLPPSSGDGPPASQPDPPEDWGPAQETLPVDHPV